MRPAATDAVPMGCALSHHSSPFLPLGDIYGLELTAVKYECYMYNA